MNKRKISMMDPGAPPKSPKSKGIAYIDPPEALTKRSNTFKTTRSRVTREEARAQRARATDERLKAEEERKRILFNKNKVRLFDLLFRIERMQAANIGRAHELSYALLQDARVSTYSHTECPGVSFTYPVQRSESWNSSRDNKVWDSDTRIIRFDNDDSDEYQYEFIAEALDKLEAIDKEEKEKQARKDAMLRRMTPEDRETLGFKNWRDPNPDGAAEVLAEQVVATKSGKAVIAKNVRRPRRSK